MDTRYYKHITITRDMLPLNESTSKYKVGGFTPMKQFDLTDQLDYCFKKPDTHTLFKEVLHVPTNDAALLARFTQTNNVVHTINDDVKEISTATTSTTATAPTAEYGGYDKPDQPPSASVQLSGEGS